MKKFWIVCCALAVFLTACATTPKVDWQTRVGSFTYDEAVVELGPPDKQATLQDGTKVAEWLTYRGRNDVYSTYMGRGYYTTSGATSPDYYLRLTFDQNGRLQAFKKYAK